MTWFTRNWINSTLASTLVHVSCKARASVFHAELSVRPRMSSQRSRCRPKAAVLRELQTRLLLQVKVRLSTAYSPAGKNGGQNPLAKKAAQYCKQRCYGTNAPSKNLHDKPVPKAGYSKMPVRLCETVHTSRKLERFR